MTEAERRLERFIDRYDPAVASAARQALAALRKRIPGAVQLVYDNYNALAIGFGPSERASEVVCSIALYPRWVSLFFLRGAELDDPEGLLRGDGSRVRHIVLDSPRLLASAPVRALLAQAVGRSPVPFPKGPGRVIVKSVSARQRPRRPAPARSGTSRRPDR